MRQFVRELVIAKHERDDRHQRDLVHAWHTAALTRMAAKDFPKLDKLLQKKPQTTRQSVAEQEAILKLVAAQFGGVFTPMDPAEYARMHRG